MISTNNWRQKTAANMLKLINPFICNLPIISINDISFSESISCSTFEIRKRYSVSGYPNLGKGFSSDEAKLSGLMESLEMCCIESLLPTEWYCSSLKSHLNSSSKECFSSNIKLSTFLGEDRKIDLDELVVAEGKPKSLQSKSLTNGLASGQSLDDCIVHSVYELIERHVIGSSTRIKILPQHLNEEFQCFLSSLEHSGLICSIYIRGNFANTVTIESHIIDKSLSVVPYFYGGIGFGCSGNSDIAIARAISEAFQCLSVSKSMYLNTFGLGTDLTGPIYGYANEFNEFHASSIHLVPYIMRCEASSTSNDDFLLSNYNRVHMHNELIQDLQIQGINQFNYIVLTDIELPFIVVRCFIDQLSNSYGI